MEGGRPCKVGGVGGENDVGRLLYHVGESEQHRIAAIFVGDGKEARGVLGTAEYFVVLFHFLDVLLLIMDASSM